MMPAGIDPVTIVRLPRLTRQTYRVHASCGHSWTVPASEILRLQLFIGKRVTCEQCQKLHSEGKMKV